MVLRLTDLRTNDLREPLGLDSSSPEFQWRVVGDPSEKSDAPAQFSIQVSHDDEFQESELEWESETVTGEDRQFRIQYEGKPLASRQRYFWRVHVSSQHIKPNNEMQPRGAITWFETGILNPEDWTAQWVSPVGRPKNDKPIYLRGDMNIPHDPIRARAYVTACGWYKFFVNGVNITGTSLVPRWTPFDTYIEYQTYDITPHLYIGTNHFSVAVADGRFRGHLGIEGRACYGDRLAALVQVEVDMKDGCNLSWGTDETWQSYGGKILHSDPKHGQFVDDRISNDGWLGHNSKVATPNTSETCDDTAKAVEAVSFPSKNLISEEVERVQEVFRLHCQSVIESPRGYKIIDFGQNFAGIVEIRLRGELGSRITLSYSEVIGVNGEVDLSYVAPWPMADNPQQDTIILGEEELIYKPWFGIYGFRYVEVRGLTSALHPSEVEGIVIATDFSGHVRSGKCYDTDSPSKCLSMLSRSSFSSSDERLEKLYQNVFWSTLGNFTDTPTDCPTRERMGWTGDIQVFCPSATKYFNVLPFFRRYMRNLAAEQLPDGNVPPFIPSGASKHKGGLSLFGRVTCQSTGWGDASVIIPWAMYWYYGDESILASQYESMRSWVDSLAKRAREGTSWRRWLFGGIGELEKFILDTGFQWGEWLRASDSFPSTLGQVLWNSPAISTAYLAHSADLLSRASKVLGKEEEERYYRDLFQQTRKAWRKAFVRQGGRRIAQDCQDDYVRGLAFSLLEPDQRQAAVERLAELVAEADFHLTTGFMSTGLLLPTLATDGRPDVAYRVLMQDSVPSWLYQVQKGATTTWETWEGYDKKGNAVMSHNHYAFGTVAQWLQEGVAGITPAAPGWRRIRICPYIGGGLSSAAASVDTPRGPVRSSWKVETGTDQAKLEVEIPHYSVAEVVLGDGRVETVGSGTHSFLYNFHV